MGKLSFDSVTIPALFVEQGGGHRAEALAGHFFFGVTHTPQGGIDGMIAHGALVGTDAWAQIFTVVVHFMQGAENGDRLPGQGNNVLFISFSSVPPVCAILHG